MSRGLRSLLPTTAAYMPLGVEDKYLRVTATYTDGHGSDKTAQAVSANMVRAEPANNAAPAFTDENSVTEGIIEVNRSVDENSPPGANVGKPVVANDAPGEVLTYTLTDPADHDPNRWRFPDRPGHRPDHRGSQDPDGRGHCRPHLHRHGHGHRPGGR